MVLNKINISEITGSVYIAPVEYTSMMTYHVLRRQGIEIYGFCDNSPAMAGKNYDGCKICSPEAAVEKNPEATFIISTIYHRKELAEQFKELGAANVLYAGQFMEEDIFNAALDDLDESTAKTLTMPQSTKLTAIEDAELFWLLEPRLDMNTARCIFSGSYKDIYKAFKQWFAGIYDNYDSFASITIPNPAILPIDQLQNMLLYLKEYLKKPTKRIILDCRYTDTIEHYCHDLEKSLLKANMPVKCISADDEMPVENFRTVDIPIVICFEKAYSKVADMYNCVYTHIPKTAGSSMIKLLSSLHSHHKRALLCKSYDPERFDKYFKFAVVRNPWDWLVSLYFFDLKQEKFQKNREISPDLRRENFNNHPVFFETFRDYVLNAKLPIAPQSNWICDDEGNILVDYIGRFENLPETVSYIKEKLGFEPEIELPHVNASSHKPYTEYYDEEMIEIVRRAFKRDIELFGYEFGKHPGSNIIINQREDFVPVNRRGS